MVQYSDTTTIFNAPLSILALSHNLRFPSPYSPHILSSDVISREFVKPNQIHTTRLLLKSGKMPYWAPGAIKKIGTSWVLEEIVVDLESGLLGERNVRTRSRNIDHKSVLEVSEWQSFTVFERDEFMTKAVTVSRVTSEFTFWPVRHRIEKFGIGRVPKAGEKARAGLTLIASLLLDPLSQETLLNSGPLNPYPFSPIPTSLSLASELMRNKFEEARGRVRGNTIGVAGTVVERGEEEERLRAIRKREMEEPGRIWRMRWRMAVRRGVGKFRERICSVTGLLCEEEGC